jgi:hypothetical protein
VIEKRQHVAWRRVAGGRCGGRGCWEENVAERRVVGENRWRKEGGGRNRRREEGGGRNMWREEGGGRKTRREGGSRKTDKAKCYDRCIKCNHESYYLNAK